MKKTLFIILVIVLCQVISPAARAGHKIVIVQSSRLQPYEEARLGFLQYISAITPTKGLKSVHAADTTEFILTDINGTDLRKEASRINPDLILAIGTNALSAVKKITEIPIIYLMAPFPETLVGKNTNITGLGLEISPEKQLAGLVAAIPGISRLGLIHDPARTAGLVKQIRAAAEKKGIDLIVKETQNARQVPGLLDEMVGKIDAFWMLPDHTVTTPQSVEYMLLYSLENRIPILTFSEKYVKKGATMAVTFDVGAMGRQAGEMARKIMADRAGTIPPPEQAEDFKIVINRKVAATLSITVTD